MKKQPTKEEQLITFLNEKFENSSRNEVSIYRNEIPKLSMSEQEAARTIYILEEEGLVRIKTKPSHDDFRSFWVIVLKSSCIHYFENQTANKKSRMASIFNEIRAWATLVIALIALIHSIYSTSSKNASSYPVSSQSAGLEVSPSVSDNQVHIP